jgi:putative salt-induced outer membrane protein YdiY
MDNGVRLKGTVTNLAGDLLSLTSDYSESIKLKTSKIIGISTDNPVEIQMKNGEILKGNLKTSTDGVLTIEQVGGSNRVVIDVKNISAINPPPVSQWSGSVVAAGNYQTGNTDRSAFRLGLDAVRRSDKDRFSMSLLYDISNENDSLTSRGFYGALKYDYFFTKKFYGYMGVELLNDKFKDLNLRTVVGPGVGYQVWDVPKQALAVEAGLTYFSEDYKIANGKSWISARFAANYRYKITESIMFTNNLVLYQSTENISDISLRNEAAIATSLGSGWSMKLANILEHNNAPAVGIKKIDSNFLLGLQYVF